MQLNLFEYKIKSKEPVADGKTCIKCKQNKVLTDFVTYSSIPNSKSGYKNVCRQCTNAQGRVIRQLRKSHPKPSCNTCEICKSNHKQLVLDHDHKTNKFRGWICSNCNTGLGNFEDEIDRLQKAMDYLNK